MEIIKHLHQLALLHQWRKSGNTIGFVPTMGHLHEGHGALIKAAKQWNEKVIVSIFVNPTQFNDPLDYANYPKTLEKDRDQCLAWGVDALFIPEENHIYPPRTNIEGWTLNLPGLTDCLEGLHRPGHFSGVARVIMKFLNLIEPHDIFFGEKDYQQACVIRQLIDDLFFPVTVRTIPTIRATSGLALSSRNSRLSSKEQEEVTVLFKTLNNLKHDFEQGEDNLESRCNKASEDLVQAGFSVDYVALRSAHDFKPFTLMHREGVILAAAYYNAIRLIDAVTFMRK
ncbi:MAG: pantoate--beta-alanine ligase [Gammaproteobacteria bacterium]